MGVCAKSMSFQPVFAAGNFSRLSIPPRGPAIETPLVKHFSLRLFPQILFLELDIDNLEEVNNSHFATTSKTFHMFFSHYRRRDTIEPEQDAEQVHFKLPKMKLKFFTCVFQTCFFLTAEFVLSFSFHEVS